MNMTIARGALALVVMLSSHGVAAQAESQVDPKAAKAISEVGKTLRGLREYTVDGALTSRAALGGGQYRDFAGNVHYDVSAPTQLHARITGQGLNRDIYYDGATITVYAPSAHVYTRIASPGTLATFFAETKQRAGLFVPLVQLFAWDTEAAVMSGAERAIYSGTNLIGGTPCEHYSYRKEGVSWEIYVDERKLICKLTIVDTKDPGLPGYSAELTWQAPATPAPSALSFTPPQDAREVSWEEFQQENKD